MPVLVAAGSGSSQGILIMIAYVVIIIGFMYFIAIRQQKKQEKKQKALMDSVEIGDSVLTTSGFYGMIIEDVYKRQHTLCWNLYIPGRCMLFLQNIEMVIHSKVYTLWNLSLIHISALWNVMVH